MHSFSQHQCIQQTYPLIDILLSDELGFPSSSSIEKQVSKNEIAPTTESEDVAPLQNKISPSPIAVEKQSTPPLSQKADGCSMEGAVTVTDLNCLPHFAVVKNKGFITVSPTAASSNHYLYEPVSISQNERSKLSRTLFIETMNVPYLTAECSLVLQEAQQLNMWDQAVAELYAQVLTITHCPIGDDSLQGLRKYMLTVHGIAC
jgi:hypothetical protein